MDDHPELAYLSAAGNRFAVLDALSEPPPLEPKRLVRELVRSRGPQAEIDGLLVLERASGPARFRMTVFNRDGSRPEACGNGLRCAAKLAVDRGHVRETTFVVETDAGDRTVSVELESGEVVRAATELGVPRVVAIDETLAIGSVPYSVHLVDMGNPHCVLFVADVAKAPVGELGPQLERHMHFRKGTNVDFVHVADGALHVRTWERGVGETASCGTGAAASVVAARATDRCTTPVRVHTRGGVLSVDWDGDGELVLSGPVEGRVAVHRS